MMTGLSWINFILGLWLIIAPFVLHFSNNQVATWNSVIVGIVVAVLSIIRALSHPSIVNLRPQHGVP
jgi:hypothetical protein